MISIFIMYSPDRRNYLEKQVEHMRNMPLYDECQKILVLDGDLNVDFEEFEIAQLKKSENFSWSKAWQTGVDHCTNEKILYLDSDRLLPLNYLEKIEPLIKNNTFVYTSHHFNLCLWPGKGVVDSLLNMTPEEVNEELKDLKEGMIIYEPKFKTPLPRHGKNPMSGNVAFTKTTFKDSGGVDPWYCGHGAFADSDFFVQMYKRNAKFIDMEDVVELHFGHTKKDKEGKNLTSKELGLMSLDNFIYFCRKWGFSYHRSCDIAKSWRVPNHVEYVISRWQSI